MSEELRELIVRVAGLPRPVLFVGLFKEHIKRLCVSSGLKRSEVRIVRSVECVSGWANRELVVLPGYDQSQDKIEAVRYWRAFSDVRNLGLIRVSEEVFRELHAVDVRLPSCFRSSPGYQARAENGCEDCNFNKECLDE